MRSIVLKLFVAALVTSAAACEAEHPADPDAARAVDPSPTATESVPVPDDAQFIETSVWRDASGVSRTTTRTITAGEERAQNDARARHLAGGPAPLIVQDSTCSTESFWLYDHTDWTGNRI